MIKKVTYSVDEDVIKDFDKIVEIKSINKSKWVEKQMRDFIKENKGLLEE